MPMRLAAHQVGDIVEVDRLGRRFHALLTGNSSGGLSIQPLDRRISYTSCRARDVVADRAKRGRPRATDDLAGAAHRVTALVSDEPF